LFITAGQSGIKKGIPHAYLLLEQLPDRDAHRCVLSYL
jgi:hypothetical protein